MIFFTSDHHFGHYNIIRYCNRPFDTVEQMNEYMLEKWNETVSSDDTVYYLGDFSLGSKWVTEYVPKLNGKKHLIVGNHDHCHPIHYKKNEEKGQRLRKLYYDSGFLSVKVEDTLIIANCTVKLHHMPYASDIGVAERFSELRPKNSGNWLLHGHVHTLWKIKDKQINVGVDQWDYLPVSLNKIEDIIKK